MNDPTTKALRHEFEKLIDPAIEALRRDLEKLIDQYDKHAFGTNVVLNLLFMLLTLLVGVFIIWFWTNVKKLYKTSNKRKDNQLIEFETNNRSELNDL